MQGRVDICQGATDPDKEWSEVGVSGGVLKLTSTFPTGTNHKVFIDNYFTSLPPLEHLQQKGIYYIGTIRMNRIPNCSMKDEKDLMKQGRGSTDYRVNRNNVIVVRWCENKPANLVSSFVGITPQDHVKCWDWKTKQYVMVPRPSVVETYNRFMGCVDLLGMLSALYKYSFKLEGGTCISGGVMSE